MLKGGKSQKKETTAATVESKGRAKDSDVDRGQESTEGSAKVSALIHGLAQHLVKKTPDLPEFPHKIHVILDRNERKIFLKETERGEVHVVYPDVIADWVLRFIHENRFPIGTSKMQWKDMKAVVSSFGAIAKYIPEPAMVLEQSVPGLTYRKLPFDLSPNPDMSRCPTFAEMMGRTTNAVALMQWIGSLFDPESDMRQYVWLYGDGRNGKSTLGNFLGKVLGQGSISVDTPREGDKFWTLQLIGKRLVIYADCNNTGFVRSGPFKSMTGGDVIPAEIKGGAHLQVVLKGKHLFFSNRKPHIDSSEADQSRIILCEMGPITCRPDPTYEAKLWAEAPEFLAECNCLYLERAGPKKPIECDSTAAQALALEHDEDLESVFACRFALNEKNIVPGHRVQAILREEGLRKHNDITRFKQFLRKKYGLFIGPNSKNSLEYHGIMIALP